MGRLATRQFYVRFFAFYASKRDQVGIGKSTNFILCNIQIICI